MSNSLVVIASAAALIAAVSVSARAGEGAGAAATPEGSVECPPGSEAAICQTRAEGSATGAAADAPQEGMIEPEKADVTMTAAGFEGAVVSDADDTIVGSVVEAVPAADGQRPERFVIQLDGTGKQVAVDASETEVGDNTVKLTGHTMADLERMEPHEDGQAAVQQ